jgi:hypothetical protein
LAEEQTPRERAKARREAAKKEQPKRSAPKSAPNPPANVQPGWIHETAATFILNLISARTGATIGKPLNVGDIEPNEAALQDEIQIVSEGREPVELLARILAHIGHRTPVVKKIEKRLEGKNTKSGIFSDILALVAQLIARNKELGPDLIAYAESRRKTPNNNGHREHTPTPTEVI